MRYGLGQGSAQAAVSGNSWKPWAKINNERVGSQKIFGMALDGKGFERSKENDVLDETWVAEFK